jgi:succinate dehydrogenase / fumarate reductase cytochrome b subunit
MDKKTFTSVCVKFVAAASGLALFLFLIVHLIGNLTIFAGNGGALFNTYAHHLESLGPLLWAMEIGLVALFVGHAVMGIKVYLTKLAARPQAYAVSATKGGPSRMTVASKYMILTGVVLAVFIPLHVIMFKYNWGHGHEMTEVHGRQVKDLYATVVAAFKNPAITWSYVAVMVFLGFHLRHAFWSALQSLGAMSPRCSGPIYAAGLVFAILLAGGFIALPIWIFFCVSPA